MKVIRIRSDSTSMTETIGEALGASVQPGTVVALDGDLGAGKTVFARGIARGMGIKDGVRSPTYTILIEHHRVGDGPDMYHFDTYRLEDEEDFIAAGLDEYFYRNAVCVVEWSEKINAILPPETVRISIKGTGATRDISVNLPSGMSGRAGAIESALMRFEQQ